jgi:hypothetical protein
MMAEVETRDFPSVVIASLATGIVLCEGGFPKIHEAAEYLTGHPIWAHQFADKTLWAEMQRMIAEQCPGMPTVKIEGVTGDNWRDLAAKIEAEFGATVKIRKGPGLTALLPTDGIPDHLKDKTIVVGK